MASTVQSLAAGVTLTDTITLTSFDGTTKIVNFIITGTNDAPILGSVVGSTALTEDTTLTVSGTISISDIDTNQSKWASASAGLYGTLTFTDVNTGAYTYTLNNGTNGVASAVQSLAAGATLTDTITLTSFDNSATKQVVFTITGTNDAATFGSIVGSTALTEDTTLTASGTISVTDIDTNQSKWASASAGLYGTFSFNISTGAYTYTLNNGTNGVASTVQSLAAGVTLTDTITLTSFDGTTKIVSFTITGTNDAPVITVASSANVVEATNPGISFSASDIDTGAVLT